MDELSAGELLATSYNHGLERGRMEATRVTWWAGVLIGFVAGVSASFFLGWIFWG